MDRPPCGDRRGVWGSEAALPLRKSKMRRQGWARPPAHGGSQERTRAAAGALLKGRRSTLRTQPRVPTGSSTVAGCYHELKSPKPRLGCFLATGAAALLDGGSSATRFLWTQRTRAAVCVQGSPRAARPRPPSCLPVDTGPGASV